MDASIAAIAAALNSADHSEIGDWRLGTYSVHLFAPDIEEAHLLAKHLQELAGAGVRTTVHYNEEGDPDTIAVNLTDKAGQQALLDSVGTALDQPRRQLLEELVLTRGPIPDWLLKRIWHDQQRPQSNTRIAEQLNFMLEDEPEVLAGMGMHEWTHNKVAKALTRYRAMLKEAEEAA